MWVDQYCPEPLEPIITAWWLATFGDQPWRALPEPHWRITHKKLPLAWRIQELAYGGLSDNAQDRIDQLMRSQEELMPAGRRVKRPAVGTKLIREYHGVEHQVTVTRNGFEYQGRTFRSLSHIAREITGTRWSGPLFFGLTRSGQ